MKVVKNLANTFKSSLTAFKNCFNKSKFPSNQTIEIGLHIKLFQYTNELAQAVHIWREDLMDLLSKLSTWKEDFTRSPFSNVRF